MRTFLHTRKHHAFVATNVGCEIMNITLNKICDTIRLDGLAGERNFVNFKQWQIKTACVITQDGQNVIGGRLRESVSCDQLVELLIELFNSCGTMQCVFCVKTFVSIGRRCRLDKSVEFADNCFHEWMVGWFFLRT